MSVSFAFFLCGYVQEGELMKIIRGFTLTTGMILPVYVNCVSCGRYL